jgi:chemotaxis signal transduction protein
MVFSVHPKNPAPHHFYSINANEGSSADSVMTTLLLFSIEGIACALPNRDIWFVERMVKLIPPSGQQSREAGAVNLHGKIIPVYSLRAVFGLAERPPHLTDILIIARIGSDIVALWADETSGVCETKEAEGKADSECVPSHNSYLSGIPGAEITNTGLIIIRTLPEFLSFTGSENVRAALPSPPIPTGEIPEDSKKTETLLAQRAATLAQPLAELQSPVVMDILKFQLAYREYALAMKYVREVILTGGIVPVPGTPDFITGICSIRGEIISLVDLRALFLLPERGLTDLNRVIVLSDGTMTFGILADSITGMISIPESLLTNPDPKTTPINSPYILGRVDDLTVLDAGALLADPKMVVDETPV